MQAGLAVPLWGALGANPAEALQGVNRPELLPSTPGDSTPIIDAAKLLSPSQQRLIETQIKEIEQASGVKLKVLAQTYPNTPGLAIRKYWNVDSCRGRQDRPKGVAGDDDTCKGDGMVVVYVHDTGGLGNAVVNFAVGKEAERKKPLTFWRQVQNKYGNKFYIQDNGDAQTVSDVVTALREAFLA